MNFEKEMVDQIILINLIRKSIGPVNDILNRHAEKLKDQTLCRAIYVSWCQKIYGVWIRAESG